MKFEYKTRKFEVLTSFLLPTGDFGIEQFDKDLNALGSEGWELVSTLSTNVGAGATKFVVAIFKKQLE